MHTHVPDQPTRDEAELHVGNSMHCVSRTKPDDIQICKGIELCKELDAEPTQEAHSASIGGPWQSN